MRRCAISLFAVLVMASFAAAQDQPAQFHMNIVTHVKPGMNQQYEDYIKKYVEAAQKNGDTQNWYAFNTSVGGPTGRYAIVLPFNNWAERDKWTLAPAILQKAFGDEEAMKIMRAGGNATLSSETNIAAFLPDMSSKGASAGNVGKYYLVTKTIVKPEKYDDYRVAIAKIFAASDKASGPQYTVRRVNRGDRRTFVTSAPFASGAEQDKWPNFQDFMIAMYSEREIEQILESIREATLKMERYEVIYRPDLSHPAAPTTN